MKYLGSKARIVKDILPLMLADMQPGQCFIDAFCGGCSIIGAVPDVYPRIANDNNRYLVAMLKDLTAPQTAITYPCVITREFYGKVRASYYAQDGRYPDSLIGWVGFMASYGGRFFDGGYSGHNVGGRDYIRESIRNLMAYLPTLQGITWYSGDYQGIPIPEQSLIYCDPPYRGTKGYTTGKFDYLRFYDWTRQMADQGHKVYVSEYQMPPDFVCVWEKSIVNNLNKSWPTEKLWTL